MSDSKDDAGSILVVLTMATIFFIGFVGGFKLNNWMWEVDKMKSELVKLGAADWNLNQETGETRWAWKKEKKDQPK